MLLLLSPAAVLYTHFFHTCVSDSSCCCMGVLESCTALLWARLGFRSEAQWLWHVQQLWKALSFLSKDKISSVGILQRTRKEGARAITTPERRKHVHMELAWHCSDTAPFILQKDYSHRLLMLMSIQCGFGWLSFVFGAVGLQSL